MENKDKQFEEHRTIRNKSCSININGDLHKQLLRLIKKQGFTKWDVPAYVRNLIKEHIEQLKASQKNTKPNKQQTTTKETK